MKTARRSHGACRLTVLYMRYCRCVLEEKTLSEPDEPRGLVTCERHQEDFRSDNVERCRTKETHTRKQEGRQAHLCQQQEVVEQEAVELLAALGFEQLPAVEELPGTQTVGDGVEHQLLKEEMDKWFVSTDAVKSF